MDSFFRFVESAHKRLMAPLDKSASDYVQDVEFEAAREEYHKDMGYVQMNEFFLIVREFASEGRYAKVLNARRDVDLSEYPLICFDMERVKTDPTLYPVVAMLITELSLDLFRKFPDAIKYILMDEAWSMLSGTLQDFIENMYRTIRKTKGSIGIITQGVHEILKSSIGPVLINNSATKIILRHESPAARGQLAQPLGFTAKDMDLIGSIRSGTGYREFFIKQGQISTIFALEAAPQLNAVLSSNPNERSYLNRLIEYYKRRIPVPVLNHLGQPVLNEVTREPLYTTVTEINLENAVDAFVETGGVEPTPPLVY